MSEDLPSISSEEANPRARGTLVPAAEFKAWFVGEILPLEAMLMRYLHRNWRSSSDAEDLRQEIYAHVLKSAVAGIPERPKAFLFATARNVLVDRLRKEHVIPIEIASDLELASVPADDPDPERILTARDVLRRLQIALNQLPPRQKEAILLARLQELSRREISQRMGVSEQVVSNYVQRGLCTLADALYGDKTTGGVSDDLS